jgi:hypothetical protein
VVDPSALTSVPGFFFLRGQRRGHGPPTLTLPHKGGGIESSALQYAYVYRRRIVVDDLNVSYINMFGRSTVVAPGEVNRIALRTLLTPRGMETAF